jgi:hypothetical protein
MNDKVRDGRSCPGSANGRAALLSKDVVKILELIGQGYSAASIARRFGVGNSTIKRIVHGEAYKDIPGQRIPISKPTNRFFGVSYDKGKWKAQLSLNRKQRKLGRFGYELLAACCVNAHIAYLNLDKPLNVIDPDEWKAGGIYD